MARSLLLLVLFGATLLALSVSGAPAFMRGLSSAGNDAASVALMGDVGATHVRRYIMWGSFIPELSTLETNLSLTALKRDPEALIYNWADANINWAYGDEQVDLLAAQNITAVVELSEGTHYGLPRYNGTYADPSIIGLDLYLAYQYRFCRAAVHRYKDKNVHLYQIENELNEAWLSGFYGQRLVTDVWKNWTFLTELLVTLKDAVKDEDPTAKVTMNFHTDVPQMVHQILKFPGYYTDAIASWQSVLDVIALDAYPNMYVASPIASGNVSSRVATALAVVNHTKEVFVMETGYPVNADDNQLRNVSMDWAKALNFSTASQAAYISKVVGEVKDAGGAGLFYFKFTPTAGMEPPAGGYTSEDEAMFVAIRNLLWTNDVDGLIAWLLQPGSIGEVLKRASYFMGEPDKAGWGLMELNGAKRLGYYALKTAFHSLAL